MSSTIVFNGTSYSIPSEGDSSWGTDVSSYLIAIASHSLQKSGGNFTLTSEVNFGATYGLKTAYIKSLSANPSATGIVRLGNTESIGFRNAANNADIALSVNASDQLIFNGSQIKTSGNIVNADIDNSAAIALSKLALLSTNKVLVSDGSGVISASSITDTSLSYLDATSSIQTQLNSKASSSSLSDHLSDTTDAHDASAISSVASGNLAATDVQAALDELQTDIDTRVLASSPEITDPLLMAEEASTPSTPASGKFKIYPKDDGKLYTLNDAGTETEVGAGGSSGINYIENPDFESDASGWSITKNTSANAIPDNGFSASSTSNTIARSTSSPLRGTASGLYTLAALGNQLVRGFTIDSADKYKVLQGSFDYSIASGSYTDDTVSVWIYDIANDNFIQPAPYLLKNHSLPSERMFFEFQCTDSTSYYLVLHQAAASTAALKIDNFIVGPQAKLYGSAVTDWQSYTPSNTTGFGTISAVNLKWRKVGDSIEIQGGFTSGTMTGSNAELGLPSGLTIGGTTGARIHVGYLTRPTAAGPYTVLGVQGRTYLTFGSGGSSQGDIPGTSLLGNNEVVLLTGIVIPIQGWSSSQIMSQDASTRVVGMRASAVPTGTLAGSFNDVVIGTIKSDTHGAYNTSTGIYTVKVPGYYNISASTRVNSSGSSGAGTTVILRVVQNSTAIARKTEVVQATWSSATLSPGVDVKNVWCNAGDTLKLDIFASLAATLSYDATAEDHWFSVEMSQGPAQVLSSESVTASYRISADKTPSVSNPIDFDTKIFDSHNAVTTGAAWKFTAPMSGTYQISNTNATSTTGGTLDLYTNGSQDRGLFSMPDTSVRSATAVVKLLTGQYVDVRCDTASKTFTGTKNNTIYITRIGQY